MILINSFHGRFGNKILQYNNLMQISDLIGVSASSVGWEGDSFFHNLVKNKPSHKPQIKLGWSDLLHFDKLHPMQEHQLKKLSLSDDYVVYPECLHNVFYNTTRKDPRTFFQISDEHKRSLPQDKVNVGIHIRGDDVRGADGNNGREIHEPKYYMDSIDVVESEFDNTVYYVCTDDHSFPTYTETVKYLTDKGCEFEIGNVQSLFHDFSTLAECDVLIASSSTFVICSGFIGKKDKKIIHSMDWITKQFPGDTYVMWGNYTQDYPESYWKAFDNFWIDLYNGGNDYYKAWKFI